MRTQVEKQETCARAAGGMLECMPSSDLETRFCFVLPSTSVPWVGHMTDPLHVAWWGGNWHC